MLGRVIVANLHLSRHDIDDAFFCRRSVGSAASEGNQVSGDFFLGVLGRHGGRISGRLQISVRLLLNEDSVNGRPVPACSDGRYSASVQLRGDLSRRVAGGVERDDQTTRSRCDLPWSSRRPGVSFALDGEALSDALADAFALPLRDGDEDAREAAAVIGVSE